MMFHCHFNLLIHMEHIFYLLQQQHFSHRISLICIQVLYSLTKDAALQFVPFISGPRNCLGQYFALLEARVVLATLIKVNLLHVFNSCLTLSR